MLKIDNAIVGPLHDSVTSYKITHAGEQVGQWDFQNNVSPPRLAFVLEDPLRSLLASVGDFVTCYRIVQRACLSIVLRDH